MHIVEHMKLFMEPQSVAIIGVPRRTGKNSFNILENLLNHGFKGKLYPVNPGLNELLGVKVYPSVKDIPDKVDLAIITTPRPPVLDLVRECVDKRIRAIIVVTGGFADAGNEGNTLQTEMVKIAREGGARIVGPNCLGVANASINLNTAFVSALEMEKTSIGVACQSGLFFNGLPNLPLIGKAIDLGNCCDIDFIDCLHYFHGDPETRLVVMHVESIKDAHRFMEVASEVARVKPIIVLKTGTSELGIKTAQSHSGALTGKDEVYAAAFKQCGMIRVNDIDELQDMVRTLSYLPPMKGRRLAILTIPYGAAVMAVDACSKYDLEVAKLSPQTIATIARFAPSWLTITNPVDLGALDIFSVGLEAPLRAVLSAVLADEQVDAALFIGSCLSEDHSGILNLIPEIVECYKDKPVVSWLFGLHFQRFVTSLESGGKTVVFPTCERAIRALAKLREYHEARQRNVFCC